MAGPRRQPSIKHLPPHAGAAGGDTSPKGWWLLCGEAASSWRFVVFR